jgi:hypothetical protein
VGRRASARGVQRDFGGLAVLSYRRRLRAGRGLACEEGGGGERVSGCARSGVRDPAFTRDPSQAPRKSRRTGLASGLTETDWTGRGLVRSESRMESGRAREAT